MKKIVFCITVICLFITSCNKNDKLCGYEKIEQKTIFPYPEDSEWFQLGAKWGFEISTPKFGTVKYFFTVEKTDGMRGKKTKVGGKRFRFPPT